jgi:general secretion pathway protein I
MGRRREAGFTLLEVVVAFVLLSLVLATVFEVFSTWLSRSGDLADRSEALVIARSHLAVVGTEVEVKEGEDSGESADRRFRWVRRIEKREEHGESGTPAQATVGLYRAEVKVAWRGPDGRDHEFALANLQLGPRF